MEVRHNAKWSASALSGQQTLNIPRVLGTEEVCCELHRHLSEVASLQALASQLPAASVGDSSVRVCQLEVQVRIRVTRSGSRRLNLEKQKHDCNHVPTTPPEHYSLMYQVGRASNRIFGGVTLRVLAAQITCSTASQPTLISSKYCGVKFQEMSINPQRLQLLCGS